MIKPTSTTTAALLLASTNVVNADLPVHCIRPQVLGHWKFHLGKRSPHRTTCGHATPDIDSRQPDVHNFLKDSDVQETVAVELQDPNSAIVNGKDGSKWSMIYDEGITVSSDELEFFSFSHFQKPGKPQVHGKKMFRSFCGQSEIGWFRDVKTNEFGCYRAEKADQNEKGVAFYHLSLLEEENKTTGAVSLAAKQKRSFLATGSSERVKSAEVASTALVSSTSLQFLEKIDHAKEVSNINKAQSGWTAAVYSDAFMHEKMGQLQKRARRKPISAMSMGNSAQGSAARERLPPSFKKSKHKATKAVSVAVAKDSKNTKTEDAHDNADDLPKKFAWDDVDGENYLEPILDQADCGSCYAVSSVHMLSARYRVHKKDPSLEGFSINFPLYCSDLNQGCQGGYPSLVSMWSSHVGLIPKSCAGDYFTSDTATCKQTLTEHVSKAEFKSCVEQAEKDKKVAQVAKWSYIGGYYGACSVGKMMADLYKYGPLAVALEPAMDFMYYRSGVYKSSPVKTAQPWVKVDHAVLLIGWGEDDATKTPYWTIQNSWGTSWGENGNIRIVRGENESGVEFQAVAAYLQDGKAAPVLDYAKGVLKEEL
ncbi:unnamed protein product [Amoebophrya sp. A25]|nr:unnamed protein product [Amoebophrya sp. A25]|eukprot:GSA25T00017724001.1